MGIFTNHANPRRTKQVTKRNHEEVYSFPGTSFLEHVSSYKNVKRNQCQSRKQTIFMASLHHGHVLGTNVLQSPNSLLEEILERTSALAIFESLEIPININYTKMMLNQQANKKHREKKPKQIMRKSLKAHIAQEWSQPGSNRMSSHRIALPSQRFEDHPPC